MNYNWEYEETKVVKVQGVKVHPSLRHKAGHTPCVTGHMFKKANNIFIHNIWQRRSVYNPPIYALEK